MNHPGSTGAGAPRQLRPTEVKRLNRDWRRASDKRRELDRLEAEQMRFQRLANPPPLEQLYELPF